MTVNTRISASDYNTIRNVITKILGNSGTTAPTYGYGQTVVSSEVPVGKLVTATDWDLLRYDIVSVQTHQAGSSSPLQAAVNNIIKSNPTTEVYTSYLTLSSTLDSNRFNVATGQFAINTKTSGTYTSNWNQLLQTEVRVTFSTSQEARHFFNSGSTIQFESSRTGGSGTTQDSDWSNLLNTAGTVNFGGQLPSSGFFPINGTNFYRLSSTYQTMYTISSSGAYSSNTYRIEAKCDVSDNSGGTGRILDFRISWIDTHNASGAGPDNVTGTLTLTVKEKKATGSLSPTGTFTITSPTYSTITITDNQTFALSSNTTVNEGSTLSMTVTTSNVANGTVLFYDIEPVSGTLTAADISGGLTGSVTINSNTGTISITPNTSDKVISGESISGGVGFNAYTAASTEGAEVFRVRLRTGSTSGTVRATSNNITISDTGLPSFPSFIQFPTIGGHRNNNRWYAINTVWKRSVLYHRYRRDEIKRLGWYESVTINALSFNVLQGPYRGANPGSGTTTWITLPNFKIGLANTPPGLAMNVVDVFDFVQVIPTQNYLPSQTPALKKWDFSQNFVWDPTQDIVVCFARAQIAGDYIDRGYMETTSVALPGQEDISGAFTDLAGEYFIGDTPTSTADLNRIAITFYRA